PRPRAASMKIPSCSVTWTWLTKSSSRGGRSERSKASSAATDRASWITTSSPSGSSSMPGVRIPLPGSIVIPGPSSRRLRTRRAAGGGLHDPLRPLALGLREQLLRLGRRVSQIEETLARHRARVVLGVHDGPVGVRLDLTRHLLAQLDDDPLGRPLADPGHGL